MSPPPVSGGRPGRDPLPRRAAGHGARLGAGHHQLPRAGAGLLQGSDGGHGGEDGGFVTWKVLEVVAMIYKWDVNGILFTSKNRGYRGFTNNNRL